MAAERFEPNKATGRKSVEIKFDQQRQIGDGTFATAYSVVVEQGHHQKRMVIKRYDGRHGEPAEVDAQRAIEHYQNLRAAGIKVFTTFRLSQDHKSILMTSGHSADWVCVGTNDGTEQVSDFPELGHNIIDRITNFPELANNLLSDVKKATIAGLFIGSDALFMLINRADPTQLDYVFGDLDYTGEKDDDPQFIQQNFERIQQVMQRFLLLNVNNPRPYYTKFRQLCLSASKV